MLEYEIFTIIGTQLNNYCYKIVVMVTSITVINSNK